MTVQWLFCDLNAFFASCEQELQPHLRERPVAIVPSQTDSTCAIAASYAAKKMGIRTGTSVYDCKRLCPGIHLQIARPKLYVEFHHRILAAVEQCAPIEHVASIDEFACRLTGDWQNVDIAKSIAQKIKHAIRTQVGECLTASIGLAPNRFLAKLASDMQKPDGLTVIEKSDIPDKILHLELSDLCGIGDGMLDRLHGAGIFDLDALYRATEDDLRRIWGGIEGVRFHAMLRGEEVYRPKTERRSISHQHVLEPPLRNRRGARSFARYLVMKAAQRLRSLGLYCQHLSVHVKYAKPHGYWANDLRFAETCDSRDLLRYFENIWRDAPTHPPLRVGIVLSGFVSDENHQGDLFETPAALSHGKKLSGALDRINKRYGYGTIGFGDIKPDFRHFNGRIAFQQIPQWDDF